MLSSLIGGDLGVVPVFAVVPLRPNAVLTVKKANAGYISVAGIDAAHRIVGTAQNY